MFMLMDALFAIATNRKQPSCPSDTQKKSESISREYDEYTKANPKKFHTLYSMYIFLKQQNFRKKKIRLVIARV